MWPPGSLLGDPCCNEKALLSLSPNAQPVVPGALFSLFPPCASRWPPRGREGRERPRPSFARLHNALGFATGDTKKPDKLITRGESSACFSCGRGFGRGSVSNSAGRVGVADRIARSAEGISLNEGRKSSVPLSLIGQAAPDCRVSARTSTRGLGGGKSDKNGRYHFLDVGTQLYKRLCPSVRRSISTSSKVRKRAFPPLPTRPQLVAVNPALF